MFLFYSGHALFNHLAYMTCGICFLSPATAHAHVFVYMCVCAYVYTHMHACLPSYAHVHVCAPVYGCICMCVICERGGHRSMLGIFLGLSLPSCHYCCFGLVFSFICMSVWAAWLSMRSVHAIPTGAKRGHQIPWNRSFRTL